MPDGDINARNQCHWCMRNFGEERKLQRCQACQRVSYCSRDCQKKAWKTHKKACDRKLIDALEDQPEEKKMNSRLSKWINVWRNSLHSWSLWALNIGAYSPDRLSKYCFFIELEARPGRPDSPAKYFRLQGGDVVPRTRMREIFVEADCPQDFIDEWLNDELGDDTVQIVIMTEGFVRMLWFSVRDRQRRVSEGRTPMTDALEGSWLDGLEMCIEAGDTSGHEKYLRQAAIATVRSVADEMST